MLVKNAPLSFSSKPAVQNPVYSSSDDDSESGGEGGAHSRNIDALESSIMADYPAQKIWMRQVLFSPPEMLDVKSLVVNNFYACRCSLQSKKICLQDLRRKSAFKITEENKVLYVATITCMFVCVGGFRGNRGFTRRKHLLRSISMFRPFFLGWY